MIVTLLASSILRRKTKESKMEYQEEESDEKDEVNCNQFAFITQIDYEGCGLI